MNLSLGHMPEELKTLAKIWPLVFQFKLPPNANIVVAGCYEGKVMNLLRWVYPDFRKLIGYDLQSEACNKARTLFDGTDGIEIYNHGLGGYYPHKIHPRNYGTIDTTIAYGLETSYAEDVSAPECELVPAGTAFNRLDLGESGTIDLLLLNMEGYETHLIRYLDKHSWLDQIDRLAVQFHPSLIPSSENSVDQTVLLLETNDYRLIVDELPQWGYWCREALR